MTIYQTSDLDGHAVASAAHNLLNDLAGYCRENLANAASVEIRDQSHTLVGIAGGPKTPRSYTDDRERRINFAGGSLHVTFATVPDASRDNERSLHAMARHAESALRLQGVGPVSLDPAEITQAAALAEHAHAPFSLNTLTDRVAALAREIVGATSTAIFVWDEERAFLKCLPGGFGHHGEGIYAMGSPGTNPRSNSTRVFRSCVPYLSNDVAGDPGVLQSYVAFHGLHRVLSVPLIVGDKRVGVLHLANKVTDFTTRDLRRAEAIAPWVTTAVQLALVVTKLRVQQELEKTLSDAAMMLTSSVEFKSALLPTFTTLGDVMCASVIAITPGEGSPLVWQRDDAEPATVAEFLRAVQTSEPMRELEYPYGGSKDPGWARIHRNILIAGQRIASISLLRHRGVPFAPHEEHALQRLGHLVALALLGQRSKNQEIDLTRLRERQTIADDLHDRVAQILFAAQLGLDSALEQDDLDDRLQSRVAEIRALLAKGETVIRDVIHRLAPASADVSEQLRAEIDDLEEEFNTEVDLRISTQAVAALQTSDDAVLSCVLRVAREGTVNAIKHSAASHIAVRLDTAASDEISLTVTDNGCGIPDGQVEGYGMTSLRRAAAIIRGHLVFEGNPAGRGTRVSLTAEC